jgi:hypothetical protein
MLNSRDEWEQASAEVSSTLGQALVRIDDRWRSPLSVPQTLDGTRGNLCRLRDRGIYGREIPIATLLASGNLALVKPLRKELGVREISQSEFDNGISARIAQLAAPARLLHFVTRNNTISAQLDYSALPVEARIDSLGAALVKPPLRQNTPEVCRECDQLEFDSTVAIGSSPAFAWRQLGLVEPDGTPTARGIIFSFFQGGEGLAVAAALEENTYSISDLVFDLANIRAGPRFAGEDAPSGGRLGILCQRIYGRADFEGYLAMGVPMHYGAGAAEVVRQVVADPACRYKLTTETLRHGDIERAVTEWRSILNHILAAPDYSLPRWQELKEHAAKWTEQTKSPALIDLPPLLGSQQQRRLN